MTLMETHSPQGGTSPGAILPDRRGHLALLLEEVLTVICRLRVNKPVGSDPEVFRERVKKWLSKGAREASRAGYAEDTITMAGYAVIAFLDESVLNSPQPMFSEWPRRPLQEEIFGEFLGGEAFFENLEHLLNQPDSEELGDLIEVYLLCLSLGFQGRYAAGNRGELDGFKTRSRDKVVRIRGAWGDLSPSWLPPLAAAAPAGMDRTTRWMAVSAAAVAGLFGLLWLVFFVILRLDKVSF